MSLPVQPPAARRDREWLIPSAIMAGAEVAVLWILHVQGYAGSPDIFSYRLLAYSLFGVVVGCMLIITIIRLALAGEPRPTRWVMAKASYEWPRFVSAVIGLQIIAVSSGAFTALKAAIPAISPFWLDLPLAEAEAALGFAPWQITHAILNWATPDIDLIYWSWFTVQPVALYVVLLSKASARKSQALVTFALTTLVVGVCGAYLFSSAGPIFYDRVFGGHTFAALTADLSQRAPKMMLAQDILWQAYTNHTIHLGNGISAMPSFHVALCAWLALVTRDTRFSIPAKIYFVLIWIGSVHLGWHYFSDGLVATVAVFLLWKIAPFAIAPQLALPTTTPAFARSI